MFMRANFADIHLWGMCDRSMLSRIIWHGKSSYLIGQRQETCLTGPLEYKYQVMVVLILGVICTLRSAVG